MSKGFKKLEHFCEILDSQRIPVKESERVAGEYPYYGANGLQGYINDYIFDDELTLVAEDGGHFGSKEKPIAYRVSGKCWINNHAHVLKAKSNANIDYICYSLMFYDVSKLINGSTRAKLNQSALKQMNVKDIGIQEQNNVVAVLDKASELVEKRKAQLVELDVLAESIFYDMFGDPVTNEKGWKTEILKELTTKIGSGATPKGGNESYKDEGISLIRSLNVLNGVFKYKDLAHIDDEQAAALNNVTIECNDVLLNITGASVARCCIVPSEILPARVNQHVAIVRVIKERLHYRFLCSQLISVQYQRKLLNVGKSNGATREALTKTNVEDLKVILPPLQFQQQFAQRIEKIEEQKQRVKATLKESEDLFQRLMQDMFDPK